MFTDRTLEERVALLERILETFLSQATEALDVDDLVIAAGIASQIERERELGLCAFAA